jgi:hypothetical protein
MKIRFSCFLNSSLFLTFIAIIEAEEYVMSPNKMTWDEAVKVRFELKIFFL